MAPRKRRAAPPSNKLSKKKTKSAEDESNALNVNDRVRDATKRCLDSIENNSIVTEIEVDDLPTLLEEENEKFDAFIRSVAQKLNSSRSYRPKKDRKFKFSKEQVTLVRNIVKERLGHVDKEGEEKEKVDEASSSTKVVSISSSGELDVDMKEVSETEEGGNENNDKEDFSEIDFDEKDWRPSVKKMLPSKVLQRYREVCFSRWGKNLLPSIELGPWDVTGVIRNQWFEDFAKTENDPDLIDSLALVYWYGESYGSQNAYSFLPRKDVILYDDAIGEISAKVSKIQKKSKKSTGDKHFLKIFTIMDEDRKRPKDERIAWMKPKEDIEDEVSEIEKPKSKKKKTKSKKKAIKKSSKANDFDDDSDVFDAVEEDDNNFHDDEKNDGDFSSNEVDDEDEEELEDLHEEKPIKTKKRKSKENGSRKSKKKEIISKEKKIDPVVKSKATKELQMSKKKGPTKSELQLALEKNEKDFIPLMIEVKSAVNKRSITSAIGALEKMCKILDTVGVWFIENYHLPAFVTQVRRDFKGDPKYKEVHSVAKLINNPLKEYYYENKDLITTDIQPKVGLGHSMYKMFFKEMRDSSEGTGVSLEPHEKKFRTKPKVVNRDRQIKNDEKRILSVSNDQSRSPSRGRSVERITASRSPSRARSDGLMEQNDSSNLPKNPATLKDLVVSGASDNQKLISVDKKPELKAKPLSLKGLIGTKSAKKEKPKKLEQDIANDSVVKPQALPEWLTCTSTLTEPKDEMRALSMDFLTEAVEIGLRDERVADSRSLALKIEKAVFDWSYDNRGLGLEHKEIKQKYWLKIHAICSALTGRRQQGGTRLSEEILKGDHSDLTNVCNLSDEILVGSFQSA